MNDDFLSSVEGFSETEKSVMAEMVSGDKGFHSQAFASELPFYGMMSSDSEGFITISDSADVSIGEDGVEFNVSLKKSKDEDCWFFTVTFGDDEFDGVLRFNTIYNAKGIFSFAFINDNQGGTLESITQSLPYTTFFMMLK